MQKYFQIEWWLRTIAANQPDGAIIALQQVGQDIDGTATDEQIQLAVGYAIADGQQDALAARLYQLPIDWNDIPNEDHANIISLLNRARPKRQTTDGEGGGWDWNNVNAWGQVISGIMGGLGTMQGGGQPGGGAPGGNAPGGPAVTHRVEVDNASRNVLLIGIAVIGLGVIGLIGAFVFIRK